MNGFFLTADLLGFSNIVVNSSNDELSARVARWITLIESAANDCKIERIQLISDTVFAAVDSSPEGLAAIVTFAQSLLNRGASSSLPIRGAITHGSFEWGKLTYGQAVINSHHLESKQNWIGITCDNALPHIDTLWGYDRVVCYPAPMRSGSIMLHPVISWDVPPFEILTRSLTSGGLTRKGEQLSWSWADKVTNTIEYGTYLRIAQESKLDPSKFVGQLPVHVIGMNLGAQ